MILFIHYVKSQGVYTSFSCALLNSQKCLKIRSHKFDREVTLCDHELSVGKDGEEFAEAASVRWKDFRYIRLLT